MIADPHSVSEWSDPTDDRDPTGYGWDPLDKMELAAKRVSEDPDVEKWRQYVIAEAQPHGLQYECLWAFWQEIDEGTEPVNAAWDALYEWDI